MRISELVDASGVPLATVKYYLREGLLPPGEVTGQRRADYEQGHLQRLRVIKALTESAGLSLSQVKSILAVIDHPGPDLFDALGAAVAALPPEAPPAPDYPRAREVLERLGQRYDPGYPAVAQLEIALAAAADAGLAMTPERVRTYGAVLADLAAFDIDQMPEQPSAAVEYAVLGTALYEPVLLALWRLAHQHVAAERLGLQE